MSKKTNTITINLKSFSSNILKCYLIAFFSLIKGKDLRVNTQPIKYKNLTFLKSPHKYKKSQEHFQLKIYKTSLVITAVNIKDLRLLLTNKPRGVSVVIKMKQVVSNNH